MLARNPSLARDLLYTYLGWQPETGARYCGAGATAATARTLVYFSATGRAAPASIATFTRPSALSDRASARLPGATTNPPMPFRAGLDTSPQTTTRAPGRGAPAAAAHRRPWSHTAWWRPATAL